jgi:hypothetical protein
MIKLTSHVFLYIFTFMIGIYLIIAGLIRWKMNFWHTQPVFHLYNLNYWLKPPGFINKSPPPVNKFVNLINNKLITIDIDMPPKPSIEHKQLCNFIKDYYVIHKSATYMPADDDIMAYLHCSNQPAFFNVYREPKLMFEKGEALISTAAAHHEIIGVASARVLNVLLRASALSFPVYYVDNLCVKPEYRKKGIPPQMIQTFYYNVARTNSKVNAYLFKREGQLNAIVPLVVFDTYCYEISQLQAEYLLVAAMSIIEISPQQINLFINFVKEQTSSFECVILPDVSSLLNLIKLGKLKIYGILFNGGLIAAYVFRPLEMYYQTQKTIECILILSNCQTNEILIAGFTMSLLKASAAAAAAPAALVLIEATAHSSAIIDYLKNTPCKFKNPTAFFLYNYACYTAPANKTVLLY